MIEINGLNVNKFKKGFSGTFDIPDGFSFDDQENYNRHGRGKIIGLTEAEYAELKGSEPDPNKTVNGLTVLMYVNKLEDTVAALKGMASPVPEVPDTETVVAEAGQAELPAVENSVKEKRDLLAMSESENELICDCGEFTTFKTADEVPICSKCNAKFQDGSTSVDETCEGCDVTTVRNLNIGDECFRVVEGTCVRRKSKVKENEPEVRVVGKYEDCEKCMKDEEGYAVVNKYEIGDNCDSTLCTSPLLQVEPFPDPDNDQFDATCQPEEHETMTEGE